MEKNAQRGIAAKYRRVLITFIVRVVLIVIWKAIDSLFEEIVYWEIVGNIAAFGLWQAGYLYFEQLDLLEELFKIRICRSANLRFFSRKSTG